MSLINGDKSRENRRRKARVKMRVKGRALRKTLGEKREKAADKK